jgi:hypothetical protein
MLSYAPKNWNGVVTDVNKERHLMPLLVLSEVTGGAAVTRLVRYPTKMVVCAGHALPPQ